MERIIAGRFGTKAEADIAAQRMLFYIDDGDVSIFHNNPPGQHGVSVLGGDENLALVTGVAGEIDAEEASGTSAATAVVAGFVVGAATLVAGPLPALAAAGVAAYTGSLAGALVGLNDDVADNGKHTLLSRSGGVILALHVVHPANEPRVIRDLAQAGAADIEQADGEWRDGDWVDFDPRAVPQLVPTN